MKNSKTGTEQSRQPVGNGHPSHTPDQAEWMQGLVKDTLSFWGAQLVQGSHLYDSLFNSSIDWWREMDSGLAHMAALVGGSELHITPDSAGPALCPPNDLTPAGGLVAVMGATIAMSEAWRNAFEHELMMRGLGTGPSMA